ncbi:hypothetical protein VNO80_05952 [Phaseolus coccineus]|uniref:Uncharacterized protein n=1 Tax=Phaseolus coccineus TaxID=3886 RepID=A0AAN9NGW2_PHACN
MRQKDLNIGSPFPVNGSETQPSLPPLVVKRFRSWSCNLCRGENEFNIDDQSDQTTCCEGIQETLTDKRVHARKLILIDLTADTDMQINEEEKNDAEVSVNEIIDLDSDMENDFSHQVSNNAVSPSLFQEMQANEKGFEGNVACEYEGEPVVNNVTTKDKSCSKVINKGKQIYEDNQCMQELRKSCKLKGKALEITEKDIVPEHTAEQLPQELVTEDNVDAGNSDMNGENENDIQDLHQKKSSKKFKRMRLLREILGEDNEPTAKQIRRGRPTPQNPYSESVDSQRQETIMDKVVGEGDTEKLEKKGQPGRKRKLLLDEDEDEDGDDAPLSDFTQRVENRVSNMPVYIGSPLAQVAPNEEGLEEELHLSSNSSPQTLLWPIQEGSGETDSTEERRLPLTSAFSREDGRVHTEEIDGATREDNELVALEALLQISQNNMSNVEPESQTQQLKEMNFDQHLPHYYHSTDREMLNGKIGRGVSMDLNVATGGSDPNLQKLKLNPGKCSKTKMDIIGSSQTYGSLKGKLSGKSHAPAIFGGNFNGPSARDRLDEEEEEETPTQHCGDTRETPVSLNNNISESFCGTNRNPADLTPIEAGNPYMREEKDEVRKRVGGAKHCSSSSKKKKPKKS